MKRKVDENTIHIIRMGQGAFNYALDKKIKALFYRQIDDGGYEVIDNRKGKMLSYTCNTLEECIACVNK